MPARLLAVCWGVSPCQSRLGPSTFEACTRWPQVVTGPPLRPRSPRRALPRRAEGGKSEEQTPKGTPIPTDGTDETGPTSMEHSHRKPGKGAACFAALGIRPATTAVLADALCVGRVALHCMPTQCGQKHCRQVPCQARYIWDWRAVVNRRIVSGPVCRVSARLTGGKRQAACLSWRLLTRVAHVVPCGGYRLAETIRAVGEVLPADRFQQPGHRSLGNLVLARQLPERAQRPVLLLDPDAFHGHGLVASGVQTLMQVVEMLVEVCGRLVRRHPIDPRGPCLARVAGCLPQTVDIDEVASVVKTRSGLRAACAAMR